MDFLSPDLPVSIIAGYLGSGKTTYINQKLRDAGGVRYGVLVNDFGDLNIDASLIESTSGNTVSLTNGCVCCSISHDIEDALGTLDDMRHELDWVLFEASGVADPVRIKSKVENWPGYVLVDSVTLVDSTRIKTLVKDKFVGEHVSAQLKQADGLMLTKTDLITESESDELGFWLASFRGEPQVAHQNYSFYQNTPPEFFSKTLYQLDLIDERGLNNWLEQLPQGVVRVKGFVEFEHGLVLLQFVEGRYLVSPRTDLKEGVNEPSLKAAGRVVLISVEPFEDLAFPPSFSESPNRDHSIGLAG